jgi:hypothetical protein
VCWGVFLGVQAMSAADNQATVVSAKFVGELSLGDSVDKLKKSKDWKADNSSSMLMSSDGKYCIRYDDQNRILSVAVKLDSKATLADYEVHYLAKSFSMADAGSIDDLMKSFGEVAPTPPFSESSFSVHDKGTLVFVDAKADPGVALEFHFAGRDAKTPVWLQLRYEDTTSVKPHFFEAEN